MKFLVKSAKGFLTPNGKFNYQMKDLERVSQFDNYREAELDLLMVEDAFCLESVLRGLKVSHKRFVATEKQWIEDENGTELYAQYC